MHPLPPHSPRPEYRCNERVHPISNSHPHILPGVELGYDDGDAQGDWNLPEAQHNRGFIKQGAFLAATS